MMMVGAQVGPLVGAVVGRGTRQPCCWLLADSVNDAVETELPVCWNRRTQALFN